ncbi:3'(2'),5'-bisphosphate nucleotidase CysQ family protein [Legionella yabuuchiae]|uniref:3'(2'),5'-bisphosphate nucleotidase CysQ family protein n=1 Tax=Legionella yabuuchiae TaxID=376727 RepID=UPI0010541578|nr:3'(2'),5'-bisphosphate nucleotidase CysQ [Legionella yabuuchiae]
MKESITTCASELRFVTQLAKEAGEIAVRVQKKGYQVWDKGNGNNPVTEADKATSEYIIKKLKKSFPDDLIISEEAPVPQSLDEHPRIWFVDPIDGTKEFIKGLNEWSVMIGLAEHGTSVLGVVYQPVTKELYYATKGGGSFYSSEHHVSKNQVRVVSNTQETILIQSRSHWSPEAESVAKQFGITNSIQHGSIGLKFGLIARGKADLYMNFSRHCHLWDVCGPEIILEEAGGVVSAVNGTPLNYHSVTTVINQGFLAASASLGDEVLPILQRGLI